MVEPGASVTTVSRLAVRDGRIRLWRPPGVRHPQSTAVCAPAAVPPFDDIAGQHPGHRIEPDRGVTGTGSTSLRSLAERSSILTAPGSYPTMVTMTNSTGSSGTSGGSLIIGHGPESWNAR